MARKHKPIRTIYMPLFFTDAADDWMGLSLEHQQVYNLIRISYWRSECELPFDADYIAKKTNLPHDAIEHVLDFVDNFWCDDAGMLRHEHTETSFDYMLEKSNMASLKGKKGAAKLKAIKNKPR